MSEKKILGRIYFIRRVDVTNIVDVPALGLVGANDSTKCLCAHPMVSSVGKRQLESLGAKIRTGAQAARLESVVVFSSPHPSAKLTAVKLAERLCVGTDTATKQAVRKICFDDRLRPPDIYHPEMVASFRTGAIPTETDDENSVLTRDADRLTNPCYSNESFCEPIARAGERFDEFFRSIVDRVLRDNESRVFVCVTHLCVLHTFIRARFFRKRPSISRGSFLVADLCGQDSSYSITVNYGGDAVGVAIDTKQV